MIEIFHITHVENLARIIAQGGLWSDADRLRRGLDVKNIGYSHIKERRLAKPLPAGIAREGFVGDYVPFYFAPRSPMLFTINRGNVVGYTEGQRPVLHLVADAESFTADESALTDGNASDALTAFFPGHSEAQSKVDWTLMKEQYWSDTDEDGDRKRRRQAEFLVHKFVAWSRIHTVGVIDSLIEGQVLQILQGHQQKPSVAVRPAWYY